MVSPAASLRCIVHLNRSKRHTTGTVTFAEDAPSDVRHACLFAQPDGRVAHQSAPGPHSLAVPSAVRSRPAPVLGTPLTHTLRPITSRPKPPAFGLFLRKPSRGPWTRPPGTESRNHSKGREDRRVPFDCHQQRRRYCRADADQRNWRCCETISAIQWAQPSAGPATRAKMPPLLLGRHKECLHEGDHDLTAP